jgi:hemoglobin
MQPTETTIYERIGGLEGARYLAELFYELMDELQEARAIREMHPEDLQPTKENFALFLSGWLQGPPLYRQKHGHLDLTAIHSGFAIDETKKEQWLNCMEKAIRRHSMDADLQQELIARFKIPADRIQRYCEQQLPGLPMHLTGL